MDTDENTGLTPPRPMQPTVMNTSETSIKIVWAYANGLAPATRVKWGLVPSSLTTIGEKEVQSGLTRTEITGLAPETLYYIHCYNVEVAEDSFPNTVSGATKTAISLPASPTNLAAVPASNTMALTWVGPPNASGYMIDYGVAPSGAASRTTSLGTNSSISGLSSNTSYYFEVRSCNSNGNSAPARVVQQTLQIPDSPVGLHATTAIITMDLTWTPSLLATDYFINYGVAPGGAPQAVTTQSPSHKLTGLEKNTSYFVEVSAANNNGESLPARITAKTQDGPSIPSRPGTLQHIITFDTVRVFWPEMVGQKFEISYGLEASYPDVIGAHTTEYPNFLIRYLCPDSRYFIEVRAFNESGYSEPSRTRATIGPDRTRPLNARNPGRTFCEAWLKWERPEDSSYLVDYEITCPGRQSVWTTELEYTATGLIPEKEYLFKIQPRRTDGAPPALSTSISVVGHDRMPPTRPHRLKLTSLTPSTATLSWSAAEDNVGVTGYEVRRRGGAWQPVSGTSYSVTGLTGDLSETFDVRARDAAGNISVPTSLKSARDSTKPATPGIPVASAITGTSAVLTWTTSIDNTAVTGYEVRVNGAAPDTVAGARFDCSGLEETSPYTVEVRAKDAAGNLSLPACGTFVTLLNTPENLSFSHLGGIGRLTWKLAGDEAIAYTVSVNDLDIGTFHSAFASFRLSEVPTGPLYRMKVRALRGTVHSAEAVLDATVEDSSRPGNPGIPVASEVTGTSAMMSWTPSNSSQPLKGYRVSVNGLFLGWVSGTQHPLNHLIGGVLYFFAVRAQDMSGNLSDGMVGGFRTLGDPPMTPPGQPENLQITARTPDSVSLSWTKGSGEGIAMGYRVTSGDVAYGTALGTEKTITGLTPGLGYTFQVRGYDIFQQVSEPAEIHSPA